MGGVPLLKMEDTDGDFKFAKRKNEGTWINTGLHGQAWKAIKAAGDYQSADWVVKVDCDAVFVPSRLATWLQGQAVPKNGMYLENCRYVKYGWFGSLEIFSKKAFETLVDNIDSCKQSLDWKVGIEGGKYGPMGEDLSRRSAWTKMACAAARPSTPTRTACASPIAPRMRRRTRSGSRLAQRRTPRAITP